MTFPPTQYTKTYQIVTLDVKTRLSYPVIQASTAMFDNSCIVFDHPEKKYLPGDIVSGKVILSNVDPISARFLRISWKGESNVMFSKNEECNSINYLSDYFMAWHSKPGTKEFPAGDHKFRFSFRVPENGPPSFDGSYGKIEYCVEVEMNRPWRFNLNAKKVFTVIHKTDMTNVSNLLRPVRFMSHRESGTVFKDGYFGLKVRLEKRLYMPGETIRAVIDIENDCEQFVLHVQTELVQQSHFHSRHHDTKCTMKHVRSCPLNKKYRRTSEKILQCGSDPINVAPYTAKRLEVDIDVPKSAIPSFDSDMVSVGYLLCFGIRNTSLTGSKLECNARISIGSLEKKKTKRRKTLAPEVQLTTPTRPARFPNFLSEPPRPRSYQLDAPPPYDPSWRA